MPIEKADKNKAELSWHEIFSILVTNPHITNISVGKDIKSEDFFAEIFFRNGAEVDGQGETIEEAVYDVWNNFNDDGEEDQNNAVFGDDDY